MMLVFIPLENLRAVSYIEDICMADQNSVGVALLHLHVSTRHVLLQVVSVIRGGRLLHVPHTKHRQMALQVVGGNCMLKTGAPYILCLDSQLIYCLSFFLQ